MTGEDKRNRNVRRLEFIVLLSLVAAYFLWFAWPLLWSAADNLRLVSVFNSDEAGHLRRLDAAVQNRSLQLRFDPYGHLPFNLALIPLTLLRLLRPVSQLEVMAMLRLISTLGAAGTVVVTFVIGRRYFGRWVGWVSATVLSVVPLVFLDLAVTSHPDTPQLFFLMLAFYCCCRLMEEEGWKWFSLSAACAGLVFACKYLGTFLLPFLWGIGWSQTFRATLSRGPVPERADHLLRFARPAMLVTGLILATVTLLITPDFAGQHLTADGTISAEHTVTLNRGRALAALGAAGLLISGTVGSIWTFLRHRPRLVTGLAEGLAKAVVSVVIMMGVFTLVSPFSWIHFDFIFGILTELDHTSFGHQFAAQGSAWTWLGILTSTDVLPGLLAVLLVVGLALALSGPFRRGWSVATGVPFLFAAWTIFFIAFLMGRISLREPRYFLPVLPMLVLLAVFPLGELVSSAKRRWRGSAARLGVAAGLAAVVLAVSVPPALGQAMEFRQQRLQREATSVAVAAGQWLSANYPPDTRILYDAYSYVPPSFENVHQTWGGTLELLSTLEPEVVVIHKGIAARFGDLARAGEYFLGPEKFRIRHEYYDLFARGNSGYDLIRDLDKIRIYQRISPAAPSSQERRTPEFGLPAKVAPTHTG